MANNIVIDRLEDFADVVRGTLDIGQDTILEIRRVMEENGVTHYPSQRPADWVKFDLTMDKQIFIEYNQHRGFPAKFPGEDDE